MSWPSVTSANNTWLDSGHGGQTKDLDGDEIDGYDEGELSNLSFQIER
jgi:hypothetical protein